MALVLTSTPTTMNLTRTFLRQTLISGCILVPMLLRAQSDTLPLREHIEHVFHADGLDEYRDDRITLREDTSICFIYIGRKQNGPIWLRLQVRYSDFSRLDMHTLAFHKGERELRIKLAPNMLYRGDNGIVMWEWYDAPPGQEELTAFQVIINEPGVQLTLFGRETVTREITEIERLAMQNVFEQYKSLAHSYRN